MSRATDEFRHEAAQLLEAGRKVYRARRQALGLSPSELSRRSGVSRNHVYEYETGTVVPTLVSLLRLAHGLEMDGSALLEELEHEINGDVESREQEAVA